jgi:TolB-like protein
MEASTMEYLSAEEKAQLEVLRLGEGFVNETLNQLDRILTSETFKRVQDHAKNFLGFVTAMKVLGRESEIKESTVAVHAFEESADFNPAINAKVRMAAGQMREKLREYYAAEGRTATVEILLSAGSYVPEIRDRRLFIAVTRFDNWIPKGDQDHLCGTVTDEILHELGHMDAVCAVRVQAFGDDGQFRYGIRGSLECQGDLVRLNVSLSDIQERRILLSRTFKGHRDDLLKLSRQVALMIDTTLRPPSTGASGLAVRRPARPRNPVQSLTGDRRVS